MKIYKWISENLLFVTTLFLLAFIPLYPKLPLFDIKNTWVKILNKGGIVYFDVNESKFPMEFVQKTISEDFIIKEIMRKPRRVLKCELK